MSGIEVRKGRLRLFYRGESLEGDCQAACLARGVTVQKYGSWFETVMDDFCGQFEVINSKLYEYIHTKEFQDIDGFAE